MKKKILFMVINMNVGGTEKALLNMISELPKNEFEITILMLEKYGGFLNSIPDWVQVEYIKGYKKIKELLETPLQTTFLTHLKRGNVIQALQMFFLFIICKFRGERSYLYKYILKDYQIDEKEYDAAIAYAGPMDLISYFVIHKINSKIKIQWIHFDISKIGFDKKFATKFYKKFDKIFVVSNEGKDKLITEIPYLKNQVGVFSNIVSSKLIAENAREVGGFTDRFKGIRLLTVGRLSPEKGQDLAIRVLAKLIYEGYKVRWYCIGDGHLRNKYKQMVFEYGLQNSFIFLGSNSNPYPYMDQCDIYIQPSRHEGYCITLTEARCLKKPIVTTNFTGAKEQILNGETGLIVSFDEDEVFHAIKKLIHDGELCKRFSKNLAKEKYDTKLEMQKLFNIL
jgi:glycosyltransferase involved in cell wall biosynthesis